MKFLSTDNNYIDNFHELLKAGLSIIDECRLELIELRLIGSVGIYYQIERKKRKLETIRPIKDLDFILSDKQKIFDLVEVFKQFGYEQNQEVLINSEGQRMIFFSNTPLAFTIDVVVNPFNFAETIDFSGRCNLDKYSLSITDLFLTKMQRVEMPPKDIKDINEILCNFDVGKIQSEIDLLRICEVLCDDWGFYKVFSDNLIVLNEKLPHLNYIIKEIMGEIQAVKKTPKWKFRSLTGTTFSYYNKVDEV